MSRSLMSVQQVAETLHVSTREVVRMAEQRVLPGKLVKGNWQFRTGEVWNWIEENLASLPQRRRKDKHPHPTGDVLICAALQPAAVGIDIPAKTKTSVLRELVALTQAVEPNLDAPALIEAVTEREAQGPTALQDGVAIPHPARQFYTEGPLLAAARTVQPIPFGERGGGLSDLFFLVCCPQPVDHLLYLGRLCRLLIEKKLQAELREAGDADEFLAAIRTAEESLCGQ
ncbi:MAG TPA: PTS sugar transporter subunit IIA [Phycisphaerae bacterium]|nr:PTS sugar transporter subunit IIA [Phycisphaerae bacterium]